MSTPAKRRDDETEPHLLAPGEYCRWRDIWWFNSPNGLLANLSGHDVAEHEDGTITVAPSILTRAEHRGLEWHGYLERGNWRIA